MREPQGDKSAARYHLDFLGCIIFGGYLSDSRLAAVQYEQEASTAKTFAGHSGTGDPLTSHRSDCGGGCVHAFPWSECRRATSTSRSIFPSHSRQSQRSCGFATG